MTEQEKIAKTIDVAVKALNDLAQSAAKEGLTVKFDVEDLLLAITLRDPGYRNRVTVSVTKDMLLD